VTEEKSQRNEFLYRRLLNYAYPYRGRIVLALAASLGVAATDATIARLVKPFIDGLVGESQQDVLMIYVPLIVVLISLFKGGFRYVQEYFIKTAGQLVIQSIRNRLFGHSLSLSMGYFSRNSSGNLMSRILNDVAVLEYSLAQALVGLMRDLASFVGLTAVAFYTDWRLASIAFVVIPATVGPAVAIGKKVKGYSRQGQTAMGRITSVLEQTFSGIKIIKAFGTEKREHAKFESENSGFYRFIRKTIKYDALMSPINEILAALGMATVLWYGLSRIAEGSMTPGELSSVLAAILLMYTPLKRLTKLNNTIQRATGAAVRVFEVLDVTPDIQDAAESRSVGRLRGEIRFRDLSFSYGDEPVLRSLDITASPGEVVALVGPSGAGKSTLVGLVNRFYDPTFGAVEIDGMDIRSMSLDSLRENISLVDQEAFLFNDSIAANIAYGRPEATAEQVREAARLAFADEFIGALPLGYETEIGDRGLRLSGGQRQRICIARAILRDAPILILDEATSALDTESETLVQRALSNLMKNRTTLVIAHRLSTIMHADRIIVMEEGRVKESGRHEELLALSGLYRKLYDMQFGS